MKLSAQRKQLTSKESEAPLLETSSSVSSTLTYEKTQRYPYNPMSNRSDIGPYNLVQSPVDYQHIYPRLPAFHDKKVSFERNAQNAMDDASQAIEARQVPVSRGSSENLNSMLPLENSHTLYEHDLVFVFSRKSGGEEKEPEAYSMRAFVNLMLGIDEEKSKRDGHPVSDAFHRILKSNRCFMDDIEPEKSMPIRTVSSSSVVYARALQSRIKYLEKEYRQFVGSYDATSQTTFSELMARAIARRIQLACGLTTRMFLSCDGDEIFMTVKADDNDLRTEADRMNYRLQVSNKPFDPMIHAEKLELVKAEISKQCWMESINHLETIRSTTEDDLETVEMDPLLISRGDVYHPNLYAALKRWGHTEEADGPCAFLKQGELFAKQLREMKEKARSPYLQKLILFFSEYDPLAYFAPYAAYKSEPIYQPYYRRYPICWNGTKEETLFPQKDRIRLTSSIMKRHIDLDALGVSGYLEYIFTLHDPEALQDLRHTWALHWTMINQPLHKIRYYFGEKIAIYFAWLGFYTRFLIIPTIAGLITEIVAYRDRTSLVIRRSGPSDEPSPNTFILIAFAIFVVVWGTLVPEIWKRKNAVLNGCWGFYNSNINSKYRPQFRGVKSFNPKDDTEELTFPSKLRRRRAFAVSLMVVLSMVAIVIVALVFLFLLKFWINDGHIFGMTVPAKYRQPLTYIVTGLNAVQILAFNTVYRDVAAHLNDWENHRTDVEYENNLIWKVFLFQFCNSFASFFYIAFFKEGIEGQCIKNDCLQELRDQLLILFLIRIIIGNAIEVCIPFLKYRYAIHQERSAISTDIEIGTDVRRSERGHNIIEKQAKLIPYGHNEAFEDYNELIIQFGFLTLFVVAFPLTPLLAFANNIAEIHVDAIKLCYVHRRPYPHAAKDIGAWFYILRIMVVIAIGTNAAIVLYTADDVFAFDLSNTVQICVYIATYQIGLFLILLISRMFPASRELEHLMARHEYIEACVFKGMHTDVECDLCETAEKLDLTIYPNSQWREARTNKVT